MSIIAELNRLMDEETLLYRDIKTQFQDYEIKKIVIWSTNEEFLTGLLYDLLDGQVLGPYVVLEVVLLVQEDQAADLESVFCNFMTGGLPKFKDLKVSCCLEDMKGADFLILHHEADWGPAEQQKSRIDVIKESFPTLRTWGMNMNRYLRVDCEVVMTGDCLSSARFTIGLYCPLLSHRRIHGLSRHYERAAVSLLASQVRVPMSEIKGVGVFGEDIVESTNSWVEFSHDELESEVNDITVKNLFPAVYEMIKINEHKNEDDCLDNEIEETEKEDNIQAEDAKEEAVNHEDIFYSNKNYSTDADWTREAMERGWPAETEKGQHLLPAEWTQQRAVTELLGRRPPVKSLRWIVARLDDEKYHSYLLPKKCKMYQSGFSLSRGVADFLHLLLKKTNGPKRTNALLCSPGVYNVPPGVFSSFPVLIDNDRNYRIIEGYRVSPTTFMRINQFVKKIENDYDVIYKLFQENPAEVEESSKETESYSEIHDVFMEEEESTGRQFIIDGEEEIEVEQFNK